MNIILTAFECFPFARSTSLGEIISSLAYALEEQGHCVTIFVPRYGFIDPQTSYIERIPIDLKINVNGCFYNASIFKGILPKSLINVFFVESQSHFSNLKEIYSEDFSEEEFLNRCLFFASATAESIIKLRYSPDILHMFNASGCYLPEILNSRGHEYKQFHRTKTVFSILTGDFIKTCPSASEIINKTITLSDLITTVSSSFKEELLADENKIGLKESLLKKHEQFLATPFCTFDRIYNPETDNDIAQTYTKKFFTVGKKKCKEKLLESSDFEINTQIPLIGIFANRKGELKWLKDLIVKTNSSEANFVVLMNKNEFLENELQWLGQYKNIKLTHGLDLSYTKKLYAGCDFLFCPGNLPLDGFEILSAMRYGCIPIALYQKDLFRFVETKTQGEIPCIFIDDVTPDSVIKSLDNAVRLYRNKEKWTMLVKQAMGINEPFSGTDYLEAYKSLTLQNSLC